MARKIATHAQRVADYQASKRREALVELEAKVDKWDADAPSAFSSGEPSPRKRARNADGTFKGDDPSTPDVNEAWEGG